MSAAAEDDGVAAELAHRHLERDAGAGRRLLEDHRQRLAVERPVAPPVLVAQSRDRGCDAVAGVVPVDIEEVPRGRASRRPPNSAASRATALRLRPFPRDFVEDAEPPRRSRARRRSAAAASAPHFRRPSGTAAPRRAAWRRSRRPAARLAAKAEQQAGAAQFGEQLGMGADQHFEPAPQEPRHALGALEETRRRASHRGPRCRRRSPAGCRRRSNRASRGPCRSPPFRWRGTRRSGSRRPAPWRPPSTSGRDAGPFMREQPAGAAHAALHLVEDQQQPELVADRPQALRDNRPPAARMPPSPCTGSTRIAAVSSLIAARISFRLPKATWSKPSITGPKPLR